MPGKPATLCVFLALLAGCGSGNSADANVERDIRRGLAEIRSSQDRKALQARLTAVVARLRGDHASSDSKRRARELAIAGFEAKLKSIRAEREFYEEDSGRLAEATLDAARAATYQARAERLLRASVHALGDEL
jgi:hypothetical protein